MTKRVKTLIMVIGALSILAGIFQVFTGAEFSSYFSSLFIGVVLIGSVFLYKDEPNTEA
jgi:ribose/xylose/arabinose/galactoside ABC-type transport system permease subunit